MKHTFLLPIGCQEDCRACPHRKMSMQESLLQKENFLRSKIGHYASVMEKVRSLSEDKRWAYRDKVCLSAEYTEQGWKIGSRRRDEVISIPHCPVHTPRINAGVNSLLNVLPAYNIFPLAYYVHSGAQLALVLKSNNLPDMALLDKIVESLFNTNEIDGFWIHLFPSVGKKVFGKGNWFLIHGKAVSVDDSGLQYGPAAFQQLIPSLYAESLEETKNFLKPHKKSVLIDLYSGTGSSIRQWRTKKADVIGVEVSGDAIVHAKVNVPDVEVLRGSCSQRIPQLQMFLDEDMRSNKQRLLYVNPPRTGLEKDVTHWILNSMQPERMAYLSCSAATLKRDLDYLSNGSYRLEKLIPFDFFPNTLHVEVLSFLKKQ